MMLDAAGRCGSRGEQLARPRVLRLARDGRLPRRRLERRRHQADLPRPLRPVGDGPRRLRQGRRQQLRRVCWCWQFATSSSSKFLQGASCYSLIICFRALSTRRRRRPAPQTSRCPRRRRRGRWAPSHRRRRRRSAPRQARRPRRGGAPRARHAPARVHRGELRLERGESRFRTLRALVVALALRQQVSHDSLEIGFRPLGEITGVEHAAATAAAAALVEARRRVGEQRVVRVVGRRAVPNQDLAEVVRAARVDRCPRRGAVKRWPAHAAKCACPPGATEPLGVINCSQPLPCR